MSLLSKMQNLKFTVRIQSVNYLFAGSDIRRSTTAIPESHTVVNTYSFSKIDLILQSPINLALVGQKQSGRFAWFYQNQRPFYCQETWSTVSKVFVKSDFILLKVQILTWDLSLSSRALLQHFNKSSCSGGYLTED